ncbi:MAG: stage II sporulation protein R [Clostridia bacterium]|nr:stage II sporulation protein R [Clostridia bacterium]
MPTEREGDIYTDTVRLHILASSDSDEDQKIKLDIRDYILEQGFLDSGTPESKEDAENRLRLGIPDAERAINARLSEMGVEYTARITLGEEWYDTREYENFTLPMGYYTSYRVVLGEGDGKNWWCVMYPPICKGLATDNSRDDGAHYSGEEYALISSGKYNIKFKILEALAQRFKK